VAFSAASALAFSDATNMVSSSRFISDTSALGAEATEDDAKDSNNNSDSFWENDPPNSFELNRQILSTTPLNSIEILVEAIDGKVLVEQCVIVNSNDNIYALNRQFPYQHDVQHGSWQ
jgi:hypothetical protein